MASTAQPVDFRAPHRLIIVGSTLFVLCLAVSATFVPDIRWLHVAQASMYVVTVVLSGRQNRWGYFLGASAAGFWNVLALFGSPLFADMFTELRPDLLLQGFAWLANLTVIIGCVIGYRRLAGRTGGDAARFVIVFAASTGLLVAATALLAPAYLSHLADILHPHWPWTRGAR